MLHAPPLGRQAGPWGAGAVYQRAAGSGWAWKDKVKPQEGEDGQGAGERGCRALHSRSGTPRTERRDLHLGGVNDGDRRLTQDEGPLAGLVDGDGLEATSEVGRLVDYPQLIHHAVQVELGHLFLLLLQFELFLHHRLSVLLLLVLCC